MCTFLQAKQLAKVSKNDPRIDPARAEMTATLVELTRAIKRKEDAFNNKGSSGSEPSAAAAKAAEKN
ncbi:unnamed protein product [Vitrella brassicaformis CCMP3155]|uniref:Uncharacterized protein n=1 Tax=Vitrella brassicaformis (strain CCMP3155) TaxID=1169540 RepID=A0A0G4EDW8_VITBC|nr:unnamed protein product [Vitrella brassicaformis CCMP3155]|eukprot:CEL93749.1 unnamed protein product [Vitrella brassicaformis CCMP3155]